MATFQLRARFARRMPDPRLDNCERHILLCNVEHIPANLPEANVRPQNINKRIYREVAKHLRNENEEGAKNIFHLKNKGITILADDLVLADKEKGLYDVVFGNDTQGIVDGGHTYRIIIENQDRITEANQLIESDETLSEEAKLQSRIEQYVKLEVLTGLNSSVTTEIARGLNTAVQVQEQTLANHAHKFDWIKDDLAGLPCLKVIAFTENQDGLLDAADIIRILELFNIIDYPNDNSSRHPIVAYTGKENVLARYLRHNSPTMKDDSPIMKLRPLLRDILVLHDTISFEAYGLWNKSAPKRQAGKLAFMEQAVKTPFQFPFIEKTGTHRLYRGVLFPMLGAFRTMVVEDPSSNRAKWRIPFESVLDLWRTMAVKLLEDTKETSEELGRKADAVGKSSNHWKNLYNEVALHQMRLREMQLRSTE
jgi:hypothetical protein